MLLRIRRLSLEAILLWCLLLSHNLLNHDLHFLLRLAKSCLKVIPIDSSKESRSLYARQGRPQCWISLENGLEHLIAHGIQISRPIDIDTRYIVKSFLNILTFKGIEASNKFTDEHTPRPDICRTAITSSSSCSIVILLLLYVDFWISFGICHKTVLRHDLMMFSFGGVSLHSFGIEIFFLESNRRLFTRSFRCLSTDIKKVATLILKENFRGSVSWSTTFGECAVFWLLYLTCRSARQIFCKSEIH